MCSILILRSICSHLIKLSRHNFYFTIKNISAIIGSTFSPWHLNIKNLVYMYCPKWEVARDLIPLHIDWKDLSRLVDKLGDENLLLIFKTLPPKQEPVAVNFPSSVSLRESNTLYFVFRLCIRLGWKATLCESMPSESVRKFI